MMEYGVQLATRMGMMVACCLGAFAAQGAERPSDGVGSAKPETPKPAQFVFSCKEQPLGDVIAALNKHFGGKVSCHPFGLPDLSDRRVTVDLKSEHLWHAICEISRQTGLGLSCDVEGNATFYNDDNPMKIWRPFGPGALVLGELGNLVDPANNKPAGVGVEVRFYHMASDFSSGQGLSHVTAAIVGDKAAEALKIVGTTSAPGYYGWRIEIPDKLVGKSVLISCQVKAELLVSKCQRELGLRVGSEFADKDVKARLSQWKAEEGTVEGKFAVQWDCGLTKEECARAKTLYDKFISGQLPSEEDKKWSEAINASGRVRLMEILGSSIALAKGDLIVTPKSHWSSRWAGTITCTATFDKAKVPEGAKLVFTVTDEQPFKETVGFEAVTLKKPE
jgi:hypothetical protein